MNCIVLIPHAQADNDMWINRWISPAPDKDSLLEIKIKDRKLDIKLIKVKSHAKDPWNELADDLAKKGTELSTHHHLTFNFGSQDYHFSPYFEDVLIEQKMCNFLNAMSQIQAYSEWKDLHVNEDAFTQQSH
ncbi:hypothetical protein RclHR1_09270013 [Rhizophagus clarus]|nr:hypothetical protein RclHR1_09270013 [Rhizophagus clarus]